MDPKPLTREEALELIRELYELDPEKHPLAKSLRNLLAGFRIPLAEIERRLD